MSKCNILKKLKLLLVLGLALLMLASFISCSNDPVSTFDQEKEDDKGEGDNIPDDPGSNYSQIFEIPGTEVKIC